MKTVGRLKDDRGQKIVEEQLRSEPDDHIFDHDDGDDDDQDDNDNDNDEDDGDTWGRRDESRQRSQHSKYTHRCQATRRRERHLSNYHLIRISI